MFRWLVLPLCAILSGCVSAHVGRLPREYVCQRSTGPVTIDGRIDEPTWRPAAWTEDFEDIQGAARPRPPLRTRAKLLWDAEYLYVAAELTDPHVWATLKQRDEIVFRDNDFEIFIDPDGDRRLYFEIEINALNTIFDLFLVRTYSDGGPALHAWDCTGMRTAVAVDGTLNDTADTDRGWSVEFAIPWATLKEAAGCRTPPGAGDRWRMNFSRVQWQTTVVNGAYRKVPDTPEDNWVWSPQGVINMHRPEHWGVVRFTMQDESTAARE